MTKKQKMSARLRILSELKDIIFTFDDPFGYLLKIIKK